MSLCKVIALIVFFAASNKLVAPEGRKAEVYWVNTRNVPISLPSQNIALDTVRTGKRSLLGLWARVHKLAAVSPLVPVLIRQTLSISLIDSPQETLTVPSLARSSWRGYGTPATLEPTAMRHIPHVYRFLLAHPLYVAPPLRPNEYGGFLNVWTVVGDVRTNG